MIITYKYKIKPNIKQQIQLTKTFNCCRFVYNWGLTIKNDLWINHHKNISFFELTKELTKLKQEEKYKWLREVSITALQQSLKNLDNAYNLYFQNKNKHPKYKSKKNGKLTAKYTTNILFDFTNWKIKIPKCGWINICRNRHFDQTTSHIGTVTISKDKCGDYWCSVIIKQTDNYQIPKTKLSDEKIIGIDLGIKDYAVLSNGIKYSNPKFLERKTKKLQTLQKKLSNAQPNSNRRKRINLTISKLHRRIFNQRNDYLQKLSKTIIDNYDIISIENLDITEMLKNKHLSRNIHSASWFEFIQKLKYKCEWYGKKIVFINRYYPSTKKCSTCGYINKGITLSVRKWTCPNCGSKHDRDINAAVNIQQEGLKLLNTHREVGV